MYSLQVLQEDVSLTSGIAIQDVLLFLDDGRELRQQVLEEIYSRGGDAGPSSVRLLFSLSHLRTVGADR
jgi:autophagy-related protein 11